MNNTGYITVLALFLSLMSVSCSIVGDIFKAGMTFGILIVIAVIVVIVLIVLRFSKNKNS
jgi:hypothetical protein